MTRLEIVAWQTTIGAITAGIGFTASIAIGLAGIVLGLVIWLAVQVVLHETLA